jgi:hypothetical protein
VPDCALEATAEASSYSSPSLEIAIAERRRGSTNSRIGCLVTTKPRLEAGDLELWLRERRDLLHSN